MDGQPPQSSGSPATLRRAFLWTASSQIAIFVITFGGSIVIARLLSPREMGVYAIAVATIGIVEVFTSFGIGNYIVRSASLGDKTVDTAFTLTSILGACLATIIFSISLVSRSLHVDDVASVLQVLGFLPLISIFAFRPTILLQRELNFRPASLVSTASAITTTTTTIVAAVCGAHYMSPAIGGVAGQVVGSAGLSYLGRKHVAVRFSMVGWRPITTFGLRMMSIGGVSAIAARLSDVILAHFLGLKALGLFNRASSLNMLLFTQVYGTITRVVFAKLSQDYRQTGSLRAPFTKWLRVTMGFMGPILMGLAILARPTMFVLYGPRWLGAAGPLSLLLIAQFISLRYSMNWELFVIKDKLHIQTKLEITRSVFTLFTRAIGSSIGMLAAAGSAIVDSVLGVVLYGRQIDRLIESDGRDLMMVTVEAIVLTIVTTLPSLGLMMLTNWDPRVPIPFVLASISLGAVGWISFMAYRSHPIFMEIKSVLSGIQAKVASAGSR